jgi:hypothetical protein
VLRMLHALSCGMFPLPFHSSSCRAWLTQPYPSLIPPGTDSRADKDKRRDKSHDRAREGDRDQQSGRSGGGKRGDDERNAILKQKQAELASMKKEKAERFEAARGLIRNYQVHSVGIAIASVHPFSSLSPPSLYLALRYMHAQTRLADHIIFLVHKRAPTQT